MRAWYKYLLDPSRRGSVHLPLDGDAESYARTMDGYQADAAYASKDAFFRRYFFGYQLGRLEYYDAWLRKRLSKDAEALSLASGRCANELRLMEDGYRITCSDVRAWDAFAPTAALFPSFQPIELDILKGPSVCRYDAIICLGLIYLFDADQLRVFMRHVAESLRVGGHLLLDSAGSPDNLWSFGLHDVFLKYETLALRLARGVATRRLDGFVVKHHGYRRTDREIIEPAREAGLALRHQERTAGILEFRRSRLLDRLITSHRAVEGAMEVMGKAVPYIRMFDLEKGEERP